MNIVGLPIDINKRDDWVAVIGSREPNADELRAVEKLVSILVKKKFIVVSGLAKGIDAQAHRVAIYSKGTTVAVVSTHVTEPIYPAENRGLAMLVKQAGCIIHPFTTPTEKEYGPGLNQFKRRLIERDFIVAKLCRVIIAVSDSEIIKGGTRYAIGYGIETGKTVFRFDSKGNFHKNPKYEKYNINWETEFDLSSIH